MSSIRMNAVVWAAAGSGLVSICLLGMLVFANSQSKFLVVSYGALFATVFSFIISIMYDLSPIRSSSDTTAVVTYFPSTNKIRSKYYQQKHDHRIFIENAIANHVDVGAEISRHTIDYVAREFVVASTLGFFADEMGWWKQTRSDIDRETTLVNRWRDPNAKQISVLQAEAMLGGSGNVFSHFGNVIGTIYAPPGSRMSVTAGGLHVQNDYYSLSVDVGEPIGHDQLDNGSLRLSLPLTTSYKIARLRSQASDIERYKSWLGQAGVKLRDWFAVAN